MNFLLQKKFLCPHKFSTEKIKDDHSKHERLEIIKLHAESDSDLCYHWKTGQISVTSE